MKEGNKNEADKKEEERKMEANWNESAKRVLRGRKADLNKKMSKKDKGEQK